MNALNEKNNTLQEFNSLDFEGIRKSKNKTIASLNGKVYYWQKRAEALKEDKSRLRECKNTLNKEIRLMKEGLEHIGAFQCSKCGHYTPNGNICHNCGYDPSRKMEGY